MPTIISIIKCKIINEDSCELIAIYFHSDLENSFIFFSSSRILHSISSYPLTESSKELSACKSDYGFNYSWYLEIYDVSYLSKLLISLLQSYTNSECVSLVMVAVAN